jgi:hypothetical protein
VVLSLIAAAGAGVLALTGCGGGDESASVPTGPLVDYVTCTSDKGREDVAAFRATAHHPGMAGKRRKGRGYPTIREAFEATVTLCVFPNNKAAIEIEQEERCAEWKNDHHAVVKALTALSLADIEQRLVEYRVLCDEGLIG